MTVEEERLKGRDQTQRSKHGHKAARWRSSQAGLEETIGDGNGSKQDGDEGPRLFQ